mmetsp:Transcript_24472/g.53211  ORF Transcript_24472/g.53211 Transcript_24472/m.53211 type:complete len:279 (+) Transcript_24472:124-960(+)
MALEVIDGTATITLTWENALADEATSTFELKQNAENPLVIGRAPSSDFRVDRRGVSGHHCELRVMKMDGTDEPQLCVRDRSTNGTGLKRNATSRADNLKDSDSTYVQVPDQATIYIPMNLKHTQLPTDRAHLRITYVRSDEDAKDKKRKKNKKHKKEKKAKAAPAAAAAGESSEKERCVELLLETKEVNGDTTLEEAEEILSRNQEWQSLNEGIRKECLEIFLEHMQGSNQKGRKRAKDKDGKTNGKSKKPKTAEDKKRKKSGKEKKRHKGDESESAD